MSHLLTGLKMKFHSWWPFGTKKELGPVYKVYGHPFSTNTRRVLAVLHEKGLSNSFEAVHIELKNGEHKEESFLSQLNPFGQVPVFQSGPLKLYQSRAITQYIAYVHSSKPNPLLNLISHDAMGILTMWMEVEAQQFDPPASALTWEQVIKPQYGLLTDDNVVKENELKLAKVLDVYEAQLSRSNYLACDSFTLADLHHLPNIEYLLQTDTKRLFDARPNVKDWVADITNRPAWKKACEPENWFNNTKKRDE